MKVFRQLLVRRRARIDRWVRAITPDPSDPEGLAPIQRELEQALATRLRLNDLSIANRQAHLEIPQFWVSFQIAGTGVTVWVAPEMAGVRVGTEETRFEAQGYRTPEEFCADVVQYAVSHVWSPPYPPPSDQANLVLISIVVIVGFILAWLMVYVL